MLINALPKRARSIWLALYLTLCTQGMHSSALLLSLSCLIAEGAHHSQYVCFEPASINLHYTAHPNPHF